MLGAVSACAHDGNAVTRELLLRLRRAVPRRQNLPCLGLWVVCGCGSMLLCETCPHDALHWPAAVSTSCGFVASVAGEPHPDHHAQREHGGSRHREVAQGVAGLVARGIVTVQVTVCSDRSQDGRAQ